jgi:hypothetical protein
MEFVVAAVQNVIFNYVQGSVTGETPAVSN